MPQKLIQKLILKTFLPPGDAVMLTAAVRDLHRAYPGEFLTDVRTCAPGLWEHNPYLTPLSEDAPDVQVLDMHYPIIHRCNDTSKHFLFGYVEFLNAALGLSLVPTEYRGDIHLSDEEQGWMSQVAETGEHGPFWIINAGGKTDFTIKHWDPARYQQVVDHFAGRLRFVQVGEAGHVHAPLRGVLDLIGKTDIRQLVRLVHHAQGCLGGVSFLMHLAAAVPVKEGMPKNRPCVVVAGGREPPQWYTYPHHQVLHTVGALPCCDNGGCWKARTVPLGDGGEADNPEHLCVLPTQGGWHTRPLPRCMEMITPADVIRRIELYFEGGALTYGGGWA